jgi:glycosyltransferase involved in cell wall biosynthesis
MMQRQLTIIHTEASVSFGGQGLRILNEALWMQHRGHRLIILAPEASGLFAKAHQAGLATHAIRFAKSSQWQDVFHVARYLRACRPDIVNTHSSIDTWVSAIAANWCRVPAVIRTRHLSTPVSAHVLNRWLYNYLCDAIFTTGDCITEALKANLRTRPDKITTIATGIRPPEVLPDRDRAREAIAHQLALPPQTRFVGCLAVLREWKGHGILIEAFRQIRDYIPDHHLLIIGEGGFRAAIEHLIAEHGLARRVHLLGHRDDIWWVLRALDAKILVSTRSEGISQALLQAQFAECPVIGSDCGGIPEIIDHEQTGLLVPKGEVAPLGQALRRLLGGPVLATHLARVAHRRAHAHHTLDMMGDNILSRYQTLLPTSLFEK